MDGEQEREAHVMENRNLPNCKKCGHRMWHVDGQRQCPNCSTANEPKTGRTVIIDGEVTDHGPIKFKFVEPNAAATPADVAAVLAARKKTEGAATVEKPGTIIVHVPAHIFPDLVMWARKLKLPKDWKEAERIKAITDFQIEINSKLGGI